MNDLMIPSPGVVDEPLIATSTWMRPPEVNARATYKEGSIWLGRNADNAATPIGHYNQSHTLLCAKSRSKKGRALITNNLLLWPGSIFVYDPKGENASVTASRRGDGSEYVKESLGQKVCVLDSHRLSTVPDKYRAYYNVLDDLAAADYLDQPTLAGVIAESFISRHKKMDSTWDDKAQAFMTILLLHIVSSDDVPADKRDLVTLRRFIMTGDFIMAEQIEKLGKNKTPDPYVLLLTALRDNPAFDGIIHEEGVSLLESYTKQGKLWNSVRTSAEEHTTWLRDLRIRGVVRKSEGCTQTFSATDLMAREGGISIYLCLQSGFRDTLASWPRLVVNMMVIAAQNRQNQKPALGHNSLMMLDEFASLEQMPKIEQAAADIAGAGVSIFFVIQYMSQLSKTYPDSWQGFLSACDAHIYYGFHDNDTAEYVSKKLGEIEIIRSLRSGSRAIGNTSGVVETSGGAKTLGNSLQETITESKTKNRNKNVQHGYTDSDTESNTTGDSIGSQSNYSQGSGNNYTVDWGPWTFLKCLWLENQTQATTNTNKGGGKSAQKTTSRSNAKGRAEMHNVAIAEGEALTQGTSGTKGTNTASTENWSRALSEQKSQTDTEGWQQSLHKKPLATISELEKLFGDVEDETDPTWPGIGLVCIASKDPMLIQKACYDTDPYFEGLYDPHPKWGIVLPEPPEPPTPPDTILRFVLP